MPRTIPPGRFDAIVRAAIEEFIARGYRKTQMSDVADAVGISKATLYLYVESKDALFSLCQWYADYPSEIEMPVQIPVSAPTPEQALEWVGKRLEQEQVLPRLRSALEHERAEDIGAELRGIVTELYDLQERHCQAIKLLDRCSDHPELGALWHQGGRLPSRSMLADYMTLRMRAGQIRHHDEPRLAARLVVETIATWAVHIKWDRRPEPLDPVANREGVIEFIARGLEVR